MSANADEHFCERIRGDQLGHGSQISHASICERHHSILDTVALFFERLSGVRLYFCVKATVTPSVLFDMVPGVNPMVNHHLRMGSNCFVTISVSLRL
jgi:hypothetical protein